MIASRHDRRGGEKRAKKPLPRSIPFGNATREREMCISDLIVLMRAHVVRSQKRIIANRRVSSGISDAMQHADNDFAVQRHDNVPVIMPDLKRRGSSANPGGLRAR